MGSLRRLTKRCWQWEMADAGSADASLSPDATLLLTIAISLSDEEAYFVLGAIAACWVEVERTLTTMRKQRRT